MRHIYRLTSSGSFVLRKVSGVLGGCALLSGAGGAKLTSRARFAGSLQTVGFMLMVLLVPMLLLGLTALAFHVGGHDTFALMADAAVVAAPKNINTSRKSGTEPKKPVRIKEMETGLKALVRELEAGQVEMAAGPITAERGAELEAKAQEMEELQGHLDQYNRIANITSSARQVEKVTLPGDGHLGRKSLHTTPGHLFVASEAFGLYRQQGKQGWSASVELKSSRLGRRVRLTGEEAVEFEKKAFDANNLSTLGTDAVVEVDRDRELIRFEEPEILSVRDVLTVVPTSSDSVRFVKHVSTDRAASSQASRGAAKSYLKIVFEPTTVTVETIAVVAKVTEQDIDDAPRLVGYINGEMSLDVRVEEERQLLWGLGTGGEIKGLFHADNNIPEFARAEVDDTVIDIIRKMRTDLRKNRVAPDFVTIDPLDWEQVELSKGSDAHYIWGLVSDLRGPRIWSLRVVESDAMTHPTTGERRLLMGDGVRGAVLYDRHDIRLAIGFVDDDFQRNLRTLRAEERIALAVKRPFAFEFATTDAGES